MGNLRIAVNEILKDVHGERIFRVLWIDSENVLLYVIDIYEPNAFPVARKVEELRDEIALGELIKVKEDPFLLLVAGEISDAQIEKRDKDWDIIRDIVDQEPDIYDPDRRGALIQKVMAQHSVSKPTIYKHLRRYWQRGMTQNALMPEFRKRGEKGKEKTAGVSKRGRPALFGEDGVNVDEDMKKIFRVAIEKFYHTPKKNSLPAVYQMMVREFFAEDVYYEDGQEKVLISGAEKLPTFPQFKYYYYKEYGKEETSIAREGRRKYEKDLRAVLGLSTSETFGPGSRFQIDATVADVYLVSRYNANWIIGRPVLYLVVDVFSRMITGMYVGLEGPSWTGAMMALANAASDKTAFCAQYGISISKSQWPCEDLPEVLLADRGELEGYNIDRLVENFRLHVENAAPYRADWKGIVEKQFDLIQKRVKPFLPGYVDKDFQQRGARDYRLDAKLTVEDFTKIIIRQIINYNTKKYLEDYIRDEDMIRDEVEPTPLNLWNWGIENRSGKFRSYPEDYVRLHLLPQDNATVTYKGIRFKQMMYGSERALREGLFPEARMKGNWKVSVSYDPRNMSVIYLWDERSQTFEPCHLLEHQERYSNKTLEEVENLIANEKQMKKDAEHAQLQARVDAIGEVEHIVKDAVKKANKQQDKGLSKAERTRSIKENRKVERDERRAEEAFVPPPKAEKPAEVIPFTPKQGDDFSRPSIKDFLKRGKERRDDE